MTKSQKNSEKLSKRLDEENVAIFEKQIGAGKRETKELIKIFQEMKVENKSKILDLGCGIGRHDVPLAKKGYKVTGIDTNEKFIKRAKKYADEEGVKNKTNFIVKDMRNINELKDKFDIILSLFSSFGFCSNKENKKIIKKIGRLTSKNGIFILDVPHRDSTLVNKYHPYDRDTSSTHESGEMFIVVDKKLDFEDGREYTRRKLFEIDGLDFLKEDKYSQRLYTTSELKRICENHGWKLKKKYNNLNREELSLKGVRQVLIFKNTD